MSRNELIAGINKHRALIEQAIAAESAEAARKSRKRLSRNDRRAFSQAAEDMDCYGQAGIDAANEMAERHAAAPNNARKETANSNVAIMRGMLDLADGKDVQDQSVFTVGPLLIQTWA